MSDICEGALARYLMDILTNIDNQRGVALKFTAARGNAGGRLRVVRAAVDGDGTVVLTVACEGKGGGEAGV